MADAARTRLFKSGIYRKHALHKMRIFIVASHIADACPHTGRRRGLLPRAFSPFRRATIPPAPQRHRRSVDRNFMMSPAASQPLLLAPLRAGIAHDREIPRRHAFGKNYRHSAVRRQLAQLATRQLLTSAYRFNCIARQPADDAFPHQPIGLCKCASASSINDYRFQNTRHQ